MSKISRLAVVAVVAVGIGIAVRMGAADEPAKKDLIDYAELSRLLQKMVLAQAPKVIEDESNWGQTVPIPDKLRLPRLKRTLVKVGDRWELPHGLWRKVKAWLPEPERDLQIHVRELKPTGAGTFKVTVDADLAGRGWGEVQHWQNGLALVGFIAEADAVVGLHLVFDVAIALDTKTFPPDIKVTPKVAELKTELKDFALRQVTMRRLGIVLEGQPARDAGNQFRGLLQDLMTSYEPQMKELANQAIARSLREGKGTLSAESLLKLPGSAPK